MTNECTPQGLNPCPFCGNKEIRVISIAAGDVNVSCKCGCTLFVPGGSDFIPTDYTSRWNAREGNDDRAHAEFSQITAINAIHDLINNNNYGLSKLHGIKSLIEDYLKRLENKGRGHEAF